MRAPDLPAYQVKIETSRAGFRVETGSGSELWLEAELHGERLDWCELPAYRALAKDKKRPEAWYDAVGTFALHLALAGWPLIRSEELWRDGRYADD